MRKHRWAASGALALWLGGVCAALAPVAASARTDPAPAAAEPASERVTQVANWAAVAGDAHGLPFIIVDKVAAEVFVYDAAGRLLGAAPILIGLARGDASTPSVDDRPLSTIAPGERTTPAGRFVAGFGPAEGKKQVLWIDYASAISIHPVVTANPKEQRLKRLKSSRPDDHRISYGCVNVAFAFYDRVVRPTFTGTSGVAYILPDTLPLAEVFPALAPPALARAAPPSTVAPSKAEKAFDAGRSQETLVSGPISSAGSDNAVVR